MVGTEALLVNGQRSAHQRLGLRQPVGVLEQLCQVVEFCGNIRVVKAVVLFSDGQRAAHQRLGLRQPVGVLEQLCQVVEFYSDVRVVRAVALLVNGQRSAHQRLGLRQPVRVLEQPRQVVEVPGHIGMVGTEALLVNGQRAAVKRLSRWVIRSFIVEACNFVEGNREVALVWEVRLIFSQRFAVHFARVEVLPQRDPESVQFQLPAIG